MRHWPVLAAVACFPALGVVAPKITVPLLILLGLASLVLRLRGPAGEASVPLWRGLHVSLLGGLLLWSLVSLNWTLDLLHGLRTWGSVAGIALAMLFLLAAARESARAVPAALRMAALAGFAVALLLVGLETLSGQAMMRWYFDLTGKGGPFDPTVLNRPGVILLLSAWLAGMACWRTGRRRLAVGLLLATATVLLAGESASNRLAVLLALPVAALAWRFGRNVLRAAAGVLVVLMAVAPLLPLTVLAPAPYADRLQGPLYSALHRLYIWEFAAGRVTDRPVAGWGFAATRFVPGGETILPQGGSLISLHTHNATLQIWLELGLVGIVFYAGLWFAAVAAAARQGDRFVAAAGLGALLSAAVIANLSFGVWQSWWLATLALALCGAAALCGDDLGSRVNQIESTDGV